MIPSEMKKVANYMGKEVLRECDSNEFYLHLANIREAVGDRPALRAFHFFTEEKNVQNAVDALEKGKFDEFLDAIKKSGNSSLSICKMFIQTEMYNIRICQLPLH